MIVKLQDIPETGQDFLLTEKSGELNKILAPLIQGLNYTVKLRIFPFQAGFNVTGRIDTQMPESCARCGLDVKLPLTVEIHELLLPSELSHQTLDRRESFTKSNHLTDLSEGLSTEATSVTEYQSDDFDLGEFIYELAALQYDPYNASPPEDADGKCTICKLDLKTTNFGYEDKGFDDSPERRSPFAVLKDLKPN